METTIEERFDPAALIVVADPTCRAALERTYRAAGVRVRGVGCIAEVERWPDGEIVITDTAHLTPVWHSLGAVDVIALVENAEQGLASLSGGASKWLQFDSSVAEVAAAVALCGEPPERS
jgi:hypothetical protein